MTGWKLDVWRVVAWRADAPITGPSIPAPVAVDRALAYVAEGRRIAALRDASLGTVPHGKWVALDTDPRLPRRVNRGMIEVEGSPRYIRLWVQPPPGDAVSGWAWADLSADHSEMLWDTVARLPWVGGDCPRLMGFRTPDGGVVAVLDEAGEVMALIAVTWMGGGR